MVGFAKHFILRRSDNASPDNNDTSQSSSEENSSAWSWHSLFDRELQDFLSVENPLHSTRAWYYTLSLLPEKERREMAIMLAESWAIFGALFLNGVWFIWEYGNSRDFESSQLHLAFEISCAVGIISNVAVAMFSVFLWMCLLMFSGTQETFVMGATQYFTNLFFLLMLVLMSTFLSLAIAVYNRLNDQSNVAAIVLSSLTIVIYVCFMPVGNQMLAEQAPLEVFHFPRWFRVSQIPWSYIGSQNKIIMEKAEQRADYLKKLSGRDTTMKAQTELEILLREACKKLGRENANLTPYLKKLEQDWHDDVDSLRGRSVDFLNRYMPYALAETVHDILKGQDK